VLLKLDKGVDMGEGKAAGSVAWRPQHSPGTVALCEREGVGKAVMVRRRCMKLDQ
jgi:hypothetical protein